MYFHVSTIYTNCQGGLFRWQAASDNFYETDTEFEFENITTGIISKIKLIELVELVII